MSDSLWYVGRGFCPSTSFSSPETFHKCSILNFMFRPLLLEGRAGQTWERSNKKFVFQVSGALDGKLRSHFVCSNVHSLNAKFWDAQGVMHWKTSKSAELWMKICCSKQQQTAANSMLCTKASASATRFGKKNISNRNRSYLSCTLRLQP